MTDPISLAFILHWLAQHLFAVITFMLTVLGGGVFALRKMPDDAANAAALDDAPYDAANAAATAAFAQVKANNP